MALRPYFENIWLRPMLRKCLGFESVFVFFNLFGSVVVDFLFIVTPIVGVCNYSMFCCTLLYVHSSIAIILMGKRELVALLNLSSWCLVMVELLFLAVPRGCLQFVIVVFPDHAHLLFFMQIKKNVWFNHFVLEGRFIILHIHNANDLFTQKQAPLSIL